MKVFYHALLLTLVVPTLHNAAQRAASAPQATSTKEHAATRATQSAGVSPAFSSWQAEQTKRRIAGAQSVGSIPFIRVNEQLLSMITGLIDSCVVKGDTAVHNNLVRIADEMKRRKKIAGILDTRRAEQQLH